MAPLARAVLLLLAVAPAAAAATTMAAAAAGALPTAAAAASAGAAASPPPPLSEEGLALRRSIAAHVRGPHFDFWLDPTHYSTDRVVIQARRLYYLSRMAMGGPNDGGPLLGCERPSLSEAQRSAAATAADAGFLEMRAKFRQPNGGGWRFFLDVDPVDRPQQVAMYGQVFALYALSTYARAGLKHSAEARLLAHATFDEIAARTAADGAVAHESYSPDFKTPLPAGFKNAVGANGVKALGTHLHLTEALIAYRRLFQHDRASSMEEQEQLGWTAERGAASKSALERAANLLLDMRQGYLVLELRDARDARRPAPLAAAGGSGGQSYLPGHGVQAAFQLWDAFEVLDAEEKQQKSKSSEGAAASGGAVAAPPPALPKAAVLEFATAVLDGARGFDVVSSKPSSAAAGTATAGGLRPYYRWLPQAYAPTRAWQLVREAEQRQADGARALAAALAVAVSPSSSSIPRKRIVTLRVGSGGGGLLGFANSIAAAASASVSPLSSSSSSPAAAPARLPPPPRAALTLAHPEVNWWTQMEHMLALLRTAKELRLYGSAEERMKAEGYVSRAAEAWRLLSEKFADPKTGAFHWGVDRLTLEPNGPVSDAWKASYHSSRAMVNGVRALC